MKKILVFLILIIVILIPMTVNAAFSDVPEDHWAAQYINELSSKNVINGYPDGRFGPSDTLTNGQFLKLIMTATFNGLNFNIVEPDFDHWAANYLKVAENNGIVDGEYVVINKENIDQPINRITVVKILSLCDLEIRESKQKIADLKFKDIDNLAAGEQTLLAHAVGIKVINGYEDNTFRPENNLTRAEASKILSIYMSLKTK